MSRPPPGRSERLAFSAAGFIATRTSGASPGVMMSWSAKCSWKELTPGRVPVGARISAGKFGSVERSLPKDAVSLVKRLPVSCMPSPESPANRMTTRSSSTTLFTRPPGAEDGARSAGAGGVLLVMGHRPPTVEPTCARRRAGVARDTSCGGRARVPGNGVRRAGVGPSVQRWNNGLKTAVLLGLMGAVILLIGQAVGGRSGLLIALVIALGVNG